MIVFNKKKEYTNQNIMKNIIIYLVSIFILCGFTAYGQNSVVFKKKLNNHKIVFVNIKNNNKLLYNDCKQEKITPKTKSIVYPSIVHNRELLHILSTDKIIGYEITSISGKVLDRKKINGKKKLNILLNQNTQGILIIKIIYKNNDIETHKIIAF